MKVVKCMLMVALCLCLCGCQLLSSGSHIYVAEHKPASTGGNGQGMSVSNYAQLYDALVGLVSSGAQQQTISVDGYDKQRLASDLKKVVTEVQTCDPIAAFAVTEIQCTLGTASGTDAVSVQILYSRDRTELSQIVAVADNEEARGVIEQSLNACDTGVLLYIADYTSVDFVQIVEDYGLAHPEYVMEQPQVAVGVYPERGKSRVVELKYAYHTSRDSLKNMQNQVSPVFRSAVLYVSGDAAAEEKYSQLYSFLVERYDYTIASSTTPTYSLLRHGVGDSKAFAAVYASMCRQAGLDCRVVSGNRGEKNWYWNIVRLDGIYYHIDLLSLEDPGVFSVHSDETMRTSGYMWDFDAYPVCGYDPVAECPVGITVNFFFLIMKK